MEFTKKAFDTHVDAYIEGGILELGIYDKMKIFTTVYPQDLLTNNGVNQVKEVAAQQIEHYKNNPIFGLQQALELQALEPVIRLEIAKYLYDKYWANPRTRANSPEQVSEEDINLIFAILYYEQIQFFKVEYKDQVNFN